MPYPLPAVKAHIPYTVPFSYLLDTFSGVDLASLYAHTMDHGKGWTKATTYGHRLYTNQAMTEYVGGGATTEISIIDTQASNVTVEAVMAFNNVSNMPLGIVGRYLNAANYWEVRVSPSGNNFALHEVVAGVDTNKMFVAVPTNWILLGVPFTLRVTFSGSTITAVCGAYTLQYTTATDFQSATKFGFESSGYTPNVNPVWLAQCDRVDSWLLWFGAGNPPPSALYPFVMTSPVPYQVFQRSGSTGGIAISGSIISDGLPHDIEASFNTGAWVTIASAVNNVFSGTLAAQAQGQGSLIVRQKDNPGRSYTIPLVGIGDVFVIYGQSNAVGHLTVNQVYTHATLKAGLFANTYRWIELKDPTDDAMAQVDSVSNDALAGAAAGGSYWPLLATSYLASQGVPIAFIPCALGGTAIISFLPGGSGHQDRSTLYGSMVYRALAVGGVKAVLWHQGESDATTTGFTTGAVYKPRLKTLADAVQADLGVKLIVARIHYWSQAPATTLANVNEINQAMADAANEDANVVLGPNFHTPTDVTNGLHFTTTNEAADAATRWWNALKTIYGWT